MPLVGGGALPLVTASIRARSVLTAGLVALDALRYRGHVSHAAGGTAANIAANLAYLGWESSVLGMIGTDPGGAALSVDLDAAGVDTAALYRRDGVGTPVVIHEVYESGHRYRFSCPACARPLPRHRPAPVAVARELGERHAGVGVFAFDRPSAAALELAGALRASGALILFEPSSPGRAPAFRRAVELSHVVKYSAERAAAFHARSLDPPAGQVQIITHGPAGAAVRSGKGAWRHFAAFPVAAVDAGGAGDWMTAAMLDRLAHGGALYDAIREGQSWGASSCVYLGARGMNRGPTEEVAARVDALMHGRPLRPAEPIVADAAGWQSAEAACALCLVGSREWAPTIA